MDMYKFTQEDMYDFIDRQHDKKSFVLSDYTWDIDDEDNDKIKQSKRTYNNDFLYFLSNFICIIYISLSSLF